MSISKNASRNILTGMLVFMLVMLMGCTSVETQAPAQSSPSAVIASASATTMPTSAPTSTPVIPTATPTTSPTDTPVPTETPTPFVPKATVKIALHGPLSGDLAAYGVDMQRGAELAVEQLASSLEGLGYALALVPYDDQNDIDSAVTNARQIVDDSEILCGVGNFTSRVTNQAKELYHQAGLAFISPSATDPVVTRSGYLEINRLLGRHDYEGTAGGQFAVDQGFQRVFIISQPSEPAQFNQIVARNFRDEVSRLGVSVVGNMATDAMENFGWLIERVIANDADLVYFSTLDAKQAGTFFREARAAGYMGAFMGPSSMDTPALAEFAGPLLLEGGGMYYTNAVVQASEYPEAANFIRDFETLHGVAPQMFSAQAYDAAAICIKAIEEAIQARQGELPARTDVANAIRALQNYEGITGAYNFNKNGDPSPGRYFVFQVVSLDPSAWGENTLVASIEVTPPE